MGKRLSINNLKPSDIQTAQKVLRVLNSYFGIDEDTISEIPVVIENAKKLDRLEKQYNSMVEVMNNNNKHFEDRLDDIVQNFKIRNRQEIESQDIDHDIVEVDLNAR